MSNSLASTDSMIVSLLNHDFQNDNRVLKICSSLAANGYPVELVAFHANGLAQSETIANFKVFRIKLISQNWPPTKIFQLVRYVEFTLRALLRFRNRDIYHCNDLHTLPLGVLLKLFSQRRCRIVYDAHEYETEVNGLGGLERKVRQWLERAMIRYADEVITVSDGIACEYARMYRMGKPAVILNLPHWSDTLKFDLLREKFSIAANRTVYLYQGGLWPGRGIEVLLDYFTQSHNPARVIVFMGFGPLRSLIETSAEASENVYYHEAVPADQLLQYTASADVGMSTIENTCLSYYFCLPNKFFEYLMAEIPVIVSNLHEMSAMVNRYGLGVVAEQNTPAGISRAMDEMENFDLSRFAEQVVKFKKTYNWEAQEKLLLNIFRGNRES